MSKFFLVMSYDTKAAKIYLDLETKTSWMYEGTDVEWFSYDQLQSTRSPFIYKYYEKFAILEFEDDVK
jgi:hypothetical protein